MGAVLAAALPVVKYERWWHVAAPGSSFVDAMAIIGVLHQARLSAPSAGVDTATIRGSTRLGFDEIDSLLQTMLDAGWVGRVGAAPRRGSLGPPCRRSMSLVFAARRSGEGAASL